jgi:hypothetical protein
MLNPRHAANFTDQLVPITVEQYGLMMRNGIIAEGSPIELLDGMLVRKDRSAVGEDVVTIGNAHVFGVDSLADLRERVKPYGLIVRTQRPIQIPPHHEPEPDGAIVKGSRHTYEDLKPQPQDVTSVIEVADSSLLFDRTTKMAIYASALIPQYVIVNLVDGVVEAYARPARGADGAWTYGDRVVVPQDGVVRLHLGDAGTLDVQAAELLPTRRACS